MKDKIESIGRSYERMVRFQEAVRSAERDVEALSDEAIEGGGVAEGMLFVTLARALEAVRLLPKSLPKGEVLKAVKEGPVATQELFIKTLVDRIKLTGEVMVALQGSPIEDADNVYELEREREKHQAARRQEMSFPEDHLPEYRRRLGSGNWILTTRCLDEQGKYCTGEKVNSKLGVLLVSDVQTLTNVLDHPHYNKLSDQEKKILGVGYPFDVITLVATK